jgi:lipopolysaccharide transport system ATP-binding protein
MANNVITVENLSKRYLVGHRKRQQSTTFREMLTRETRDFARKAIDLAHGRQIIEGDEVEEFWALQDVSFEAQEGDVLGIIGRNGAGKSTLLKILSRITEPTKGRITLRGRVSSLLEVGTGFHPELTGRENIYLNGAILGMRRSEINAQFDRIVDFAEVENFLDMPVKWYSSGMYVRLAFAVAAHLSPEILLVDEVLAVGDASFQAKCLNKMGDAARSGRTILFVSHNTNAIERLCDRVVVLDKGGVAGTFDNPREGIGFYLGRGGMSTIWTNSGSEFRDNDYFTPQLIEAKSDSCAGAAFPQDHAIILTIDGVVHQSDPALQIGLFIYDDAERLVFMSWSTDSVEKNWPRLDRGPVRLSVTIPPRWLNEGIYRVELQAAIALRQWLIEPGNSAFVKFSIQGGLNASPYWTKRGGVLAPVLEWQKSTVT